MELQLTLLIRFLYAYKAFTLDLITLRIQKLFDPIAQYREIETHYVRTHKSVSSMNSNPFEC